ncbi:MAG TPA: N-6 DNA methylase [Thermoanaerobaculia bacterium]|nr:N-6 DNA methylase [Thermoanaerobaculia bacterium]
MLTRERVRNGDVLELLRELGYPVAPIDVDPDEWRRGGVPLPWNGEARLRLAARMRDFDLFLLTGDVGEESVSQFLSTYREYNLLTKSAVVYQHDHSISIFDYVHDRGLRRLDVDLTNPTPHAIDRLNLLALGEESSLPRVFDRALDRESVTRQFFQRFRTAVRDVAEALGTEYPREEREAVDGEALLILSRLLFLSFIQEKGWLGGERRFLVDRLEHEIARGREFFSGVLLPLFFGCLNTPLHERKLAARKLGSVPYLNGGLFEPSPFEQRHRDLHLPNELMQRVLEEVFEKFDFRVDEGDAAGTHVDPEMLGKVFEALMAADERAASGSFYTPREIVDVLTERAVTEWLCGGQAILPAQHQTGKIACPPLVARRLLGKLESITILDPACGSGAFLLSALGVIERLYRRLAAEAGVEVPRDLRQRIVANSLYGVDLKPEAVRLCELRLWLAIVSGSEASIEQIRPLPNLDRNILQGNSLLAPTDFLGGARADLYRDWVVALHAQRELLERYRTASHAERPAIYRIIRGNDQRLAAELLTKLVEGTERELQSLAAPQRDLFGRIIPVDTDHFRDLQARGAEARRMLDRVEEGTLDFFSFDIHFAHVMAAGGFDVVVGNPPWVRNSRIEPRAKRMYADRYTLFRAQRGGDAGFHQPDLSVAFFERALQLAAPSGVVALLMPAKIANAAYAEPLRRAARDRVIAIDDWSDDPRRRRWFEADTFPMGIVLHCHDAERTDRLLPVERSDRLQPVDGRAEARPYVHVSTHGESFDIDRLSLATPEWSLVPERVAAILRRLRESHPPLAAALRRKPIMGVKTGDNRSFFLDEKRVSKGRLVTTDGVYIPLDAVCRCVRGRDLQRWSASASKWMLWPPVGGWKKPPRWLQHLAKERGMEPEEFRLSFVKPEHVGIKVAWKDLSRGVAAAVLPDVVHIHGQAFPLVPNQTLYMLDAVSLDEAHLIAAILNSTIAGALLVSVAERAKDSHYRYFGRTIAAMPYPDTRAECDALVRAARRASHDVDAIVARLYGISEEELNVLRDFLERRLGAR